MSAAIAPWLQGLDETWEAPSTVPRTISSASHDAGSLRSDQSRASRRSLNGLPPTLGSHKTSSNATTQIKRSPLAPLSKSYTNTVSRQNGSTQMAGTRSVSYTSGDSMEEYGTVQQRSKSASPVKKQETLEWKRRLVKGQVGYGDQTELFAASGLENIFAQSKRPENDAPRQKDRMRWLPQSEVGLPSSPPPWPSSLMRDQQEVRQNSLRNVSEEQPNSLWEPSEQSNNDSFRSNPFDLHNTDDPEDDCESVLQDSHSIGHLQPPTEPTGNRTVSGQTELSQEDFSPVFMTKHTNPNGQVNYAALDSHMVKKFQTMEVNLRHPSQEAPQRDTAANQGEDSSDPLDFSDGPQSDSEAPNQDFSLSENLPTGTPPAVSLGSRVQFRRGGWSTVDSFKDRPLSPSPSKSEAESVTSKRSTGTPSALSVGRPLPAIPTSPGHAPTTPLRPVTPDPPKSRSSASPLKLFAAHDTFTSNRLLRRISQLDPESFQVEDREQQRVEESAVEDEEIALDDLHGSMGNSFGSGKLNGHPFGAEITITSASDPEENDSERTPGSEIHVPGSKLPFGFRLDTSADVQDTFKLKRKLSKQSAARSSKNSTINSVKGTLGALQPTANDASDLDAYYERAEQVKNYEGGKRPPNSPFKNPTPKRRRTIHVSELEDELAAADFSYHSRLNEAISSRKRRDSSHDEHHSMADREILASRKMLRPRNPTPSQRRRQQLEADLKEVAEEFAAQEPEKLEAVMEQIEASMAGSESPPTLQQQAAVVAAEVANFSLRVQKPSGEHGGRKPSVTTQDFLTEAMMVMQLIRAKARPRSNLSSVEESEIEGQSPEEEASRLDVTDPLRVSRPPSREGGHSGWRSGQQSQTDARVMSHLRKFQEHDDTEFIAESMASLGVDEDSLNDNVVVVDEESNVRILGPSKEEHFMTEDAEDSRPVTQGSQASTNQTQQSDGTSTGRTICTTSTRKSEQVGTLAPDDVAHLIGEQIGGMTYDKDQQRWVRMKSPKKKEKSEFLEPPSHLTSDDDPFREISDLQVDEQVEARRVSSSGRSALMDEELQKSQNGVAQQQESLRNGSRTSNETIVPRPVTSDGKRSHHAHSSSVPSHYTAFGSSQQGKVETRATSWSDEELAMMSTMGKARHQPLAYAAAQATLALRGQRDALTEDSIGDLTNVTEQPDLEEKSESDQSVVCRESAHNAAQPNDGLREDTAVDADDSVIEHILSPRLRQSQRQVHQAPPIPAYGRPPQVSLRKQTLTNRFTNTAHEHSELSLVAALPGERTMSVSLSVSRPVATRHQSRIAELQSSPSKPGLNSTFLLSDLPDFTIHEEDEEKPSERALAARLAQHATAEVNDRYALAVKDLVRTLTDVSEGVPYWEDIKELDLRGRSLDSLYGLEDFCTRVEGMDVSDNHLTQLHGAPSTIRSLQARSNQLTSVAYWGHLVNLQYLDVSNNQLDSLQGLSHLVHLREIVADDNSIVSLDGISALDGLLKIRLRRNSIEMIDFEKSQLHRLTELDLVDNKISAVKHLEHLAALEKLKLDGNVLEHGVVLHQRMTRLELVSMRSCGLKTLDVSMLPSLRELDIDDNELPTVLGAHTLTGLETLSMRRQKLPEGVSVSIFNNALDARCIRLSGNAIPSLNLTHNFFNLRHLELASVGLQTLPDDFGLRMPNLRTLNANFNSLKDIRPLLNIEKLEHLYLAGNRIDRLRKTIATLGKMQSLQTVDLRDNPVTQCFYAPAVTAQTTLIPLAHPHGNADEDECREATEKARYCLPPGDEVEDEQRSMRMDDETRMKRRVYELLLAHNCPALRYLDGLAFKKDRANVKDHIWGRLVELGVVRKSRAA